MLGRILSLIAVLVLAGASTQTHAYARALQPESAHRACASLDQSGSGQSVDVSPSRAKEKCIAAQKSTLGVSVDGNGNLITQRDANGIVTTHEYDAANQKIRSTRDDSSESWTYTPTNQIATHTDGKGDSTVFAYDPRDRVLTETNAEGETRSYSYDANGNRTIIKLPNNKIWTQTFDTANRLTSVKTPEGHTTTFTHHADDQLASITDAITHRVTLTSDALARIASRTYPGGAVFTTLFDGEGNAKQEQNPDTNITRTFDGLNRATAETFTGALATATLNTTFDPNSNPITHSATHASRTLNNTRRFDDLNRLEGEQGQANGAPPAIPNAYTHSQRYALDGNGNRTSWTDANGKTTTQTFDAFNRIKTSTTAGEGTTTNAWNKDGTLQSISRSNGTATSYQYDRAKRITSITHTQNGATTLSFVYTYDQNGNRTNEVKTQSAINGQAGSITTTVYGYDGDDRLLSTDVRQVPPSLTTPNEKTVWTLDGVGNRLTEIVTRESGTVTTSSKVYSYSARDQLELMTDSVNQLTVAYGYSQNGNRTSRTVTRQNPPSTETVTYTFDARDRMIKAQPNAPNAPTVEYVYDADGRQVERIETPAGGGTPTATLYVYNGQTLLHEADPSNGGGGLRISDTYRSSALLDRHIAIAQGGAMTLRFYQLDALNTPVAMTDSNGDTVTRTTYSAWGEIEEQVANGVVQAPWQLPSYNSDTSGQAALLSNDGQSIGFTGYRKDEDTGLYYAQARWYDPLIGGFNGMDPWAGNNSHPVTFNKYLYGRSNPLSYIDLDGKVSFLSSAQEYLRSTVQSYETQLGQAVAEDAGGRAFGLGVGKALASVGEMVVSGLNTTSNLIAQHHYDGDVYDQTQRELRANEAGAGDIIAGGHVLGQKVYDDPIGTAQQVGTSAVDFAERLAAADARALGTAGEITGGLLIPAGGAGKKALDQGLDAARIAGRLDLDVSDIVRDLDEGFRPANAAHGVRAVEKPSGGVGVVANKSPICGSGGPCSVYEIPESELIADLPYIGKTRREIDKRMADKDHRKKTPTGQPPKAKPLAENLTPDEAAGLEALLANERGLGNLSNAIPPLNLNLPKNAGRLEAARKLLEKARGGGGSQ